MSHVARHPRNCRHFWNLIWRRGFKSDDIYEDEHVGRAIL